MPFYLVRSPTRVDSKRTHNVARDWSVNPRPARRRCTPSTEELLCGLEETPICYSVLERTKPADPRSGLNYSSEHCLLDKLDTLITYMRQSSHYFQKRSVTTDGSQLPLSPSCSGNRPCCDPGISFGSSNYSNYMSGLSMR